MNHTARRATKWCALLALAAILRTSPAQATHGREGSDGVDAAGPPGVPPAAAAAASGGRLTLPEALRADQTKRVYSGYYPTWNDNGFSADGRSANEVYKASKFARIPATYTHVMVAFANPKFRWGGLAANNWSGTGIDFKGAPQDIRAAIEVLHQRDIKVILAVGGADYNDWTALADEGRRGQGPITTALAAAMRDLGFDGLDVDYEADADVTRYASAIKAMRKAVDIAGEGRVLTAAAWSTGADCTAQTAADPDCAGRISYWKGNAGRERLLVSQYPAVAAAIDILNVMSYDARYEHYDGVLAYHQYRRLFGPRTIVSIGLESAPEGFAGGQLVVNDADAQCAGSRTLQDAYGAVVNAPYSVERYTEAVARGTNRNRNPRDGAMLWSILKPTHAACGMAALASPGTIGTKVAVTFSLPQDPLLQHDDWR